MSVSAQNQSKAVVFVNASCHFREPVYARQVVFLLRILRLAFRLAMSLAISRYLHADPSLNTHVITVYDDDGRARQELRVLGRWVVGAGLLSLVAGGQESDVRTVSRRLGLGEVW